MKRDYIYLFLFLGMLLFGLFWAVGIRPFLLKNNISAFYIADCMPNFLAVLILTFGAMALSRYNNQRDIFKLSMTFTGSMITYEFLQLIIPQRVFDFKDIIASIFGGLVSYLILLLINRMITKSNVRE